MLRRHDDLADKTSMVLILGLSLLMAIGWVLNLYKLIAYNDFASPYKTEVIRTAGVFVPPAGMLTGWMTFDDEQ